MFFKETIPAENEKNSSQPMANYRYSGDKIIFPKKQHLHHSLF